MGSSRGTIVIVLVACEIAILTAIISLLGGRSIASAGFNLHPVWVDSGARREIASIQAGTSPNLFVSDPDSKVIIKPSIDGRVHVIDRWSAQGWRLGGAQKIPALRVTQGADGIHVYRDSSQNKNIFLIFGSSTERTEIDVPVATAIDVAKSSGSDISGVQATVRVRSQDGRITLDSIHGNVDAQADDGRIYVHDLQGETVMLSSNSGRIELTRVSARTLTATTRDGHILVQDLQISGDGAAAQVHSDDGYIDFTGRLADTGHYSIGTNDGHIHLNVPSLSALTIHAHSQDGSIRVDGMRSGSGDGPSNYEAAGTAAGNIQLATQSGSITITNTGAN